MAIKFTKYQTKILEIYFNNPEKEYYVRELARLIKKEPGVFQRDLNKLEEFGILESYILGKSRFFRLNKKHQLYMELQALFKKAVGIEPRLKELINKMPSVKKAFIYGSVAKGSEMSSSDIDLFIVGSDKDEDLLLKEIDNLENTFQREINYTLASEEEYNKKLKEKDSFLLNILNDKIIELK